MRITGFRVDGFGLLHDQGVDGIGPGTTVVLGPNEAGKSTLHAFLVRTLFGHPRSNDAEGRNRHEPLRGGRHGGVVRAEDDAGSWEVHRFTEGSPRLRVVAPDGSEHTATDAVLPLLGRTVDEARYEQVFAIDLDDLAGIGSLGGGSLDDLLFDAATVGTGRSLRAARDEAVARRDELWTPTATKRPLAVALDRRAAARDRLAAARDDARAHLDLRRRLDAAAARVEELGRRQEELVARATLLERVRDAWPAWSRAARLQASLDDLPQADVDEDALAAARTAHDAVEDHDRRLAELDVELDELTRAIDRSTVDSDALAVAEEVEALAEGLAAHELAVEQVAAAEADLAAADRSLAAAVAALGPGWDEAALATVAVDAPAREGLVAAADAVREAAAADAAAADAVGDARRAAARHAEDLAAAEAALPDAPGEDEVARAEQDLAVLRAGVVALAQADATHGEASDGLPAAGPPLVATVLLVAAAVLVLPAVLGLLPDAAPTAVVASLGAVLAAAGAFLLGRARASAVGSPVRRAASSVGAVEADVAAAARRLGLHDRPSLADVERVAASVEGARRQRRAHADARRHLDRVRAEAREAQRLLDDRAEVAAARAAVHEEATSAWTELCAGVGLDPRGDVRVVLTVHDRVTAARRALDDRDAAADRAAAARPRVTAFRARAVAVADKLGHDADGQAAVRLLPGLRERVRAARAAEAERQRLVARRADVEEHRTAVEADRTTAMRARDEALASAGAADPQDLEATAAAAAARADLTADLRAAEEAVDQVLGAGPRGADGRSLLAAQDPTAWEQELATVRAARSAAAEERDAALAERTELEAELRRLGGDDAVPRAEQALAAAEVEVASLAERWAVADTAARLLEATVARFEREQQPRVLSRASELLRRATGGQWAQVRRLDDQVVVARHEGGDPVPAEVLSRGTREQLWLCLRLALAEDLSQDRPLPLLVDDLLGTSDPERSLHVARVLAEVARRQQVWLFTCHPRTAELVTSVDPTAGVLRLRRGGTVVGLTRRDVAAEDVEAAGPSPTLFGG